VLADASGAPVDGALVTLVPHFELEDESGPALPFTCVSSAGGRFRFDGVPAGRYGLTATSPRGAAYGGVVEIGPAPRPEARLTLRDGAFTVRGRVTDDAGAPVPRAAVRAARFSEDEGEVYAAITDDAGRYALALPGGLPFVLVADAPPRPRAHRRIEPAPGTADLTLSPPPPPRPSDEAIAAWLHEAAVPFSDTPPGGSNGDLDVIAAEIGSTTIVGLGEATHGSSEIFRTKHRLIERLVDYLGFRVLAVETGWSDALAVNDYVLTGRGDPAEALRKLVTWSCENEEVLALVRWMRRWNEDPKHTPKLEFQGIDAVTPAAAAAVLAYLAKADPEAARASEATIAPFRSPSATEAWTRPGVHDALAALVTRFDARRAAYAAKTGEGAWTIARRHALMLLWAQEEAQDPSTRDGHMAENVAWLVDTHPAGTRFVLWAHNSHVMTAPFELWDLGTRLRARYHGGYFALGFAFDHGAFLAMDRRSAHPYDPVPLSVGAAPPGSFDAALGLADTWNKRFFVDLRLAPEALRPWLDAPMAAWLVRGWFDGEAHAIARIAPRKSFDAVIYLRELTAAHPLPKRAAPP
jgi:erythromycin esterase